MPAPELSPTEQLQGTDNIMIQIQPIILCGGSGSRLWPLSREKYPKQLLQLTGKSSLFEATLQRLGGIEAASLQSPMVVCNEEYRFIIAEQLRTESHSGVLILEPQGRNTAPALTLAALEAVHRGTDPVLLVMPADHVISDKASFQAAVVRGGEVASQGHVVTFGITPTGPETGYGYIRAAEKGAAGQALPILSFVEKPNLETATRYVSEGTYLWNSGIFMMKASVWLAALGECRPDILKACQQSLDHRAPDGEFVRVGKKEFADCPSDSIDYAVMERLTQKASASQLPTAYVLPLSAGWSDVGAWEALWDVQDKDANGNVTTGDVMMEDSRNSLVLSGSRLVTCIGVKDLVVVETPDAVLVVHKDRTQDVKKIVNRLQQDGRSEVTNHRKVYRPWGWYDSIDNGARFQVKRIVVKPGGILSLQMHHHRAEHWIVVKGTAMVTKGEQTIMVSENESTYIPLGTVHRLENPGRVELEMIEVQSGSYLGEDDIVRYEDMYGRDKA
jgi:mannose-1-phosphate guanylyltransferase / mannose-6-phosphate isomerase